MRLLAYLLLASLVQAPELEATELKNKTLQAFDLYVRLTEERVNKEAGGDGPDSLVQLGPGQFDASADDLRAML